MSANDAAAWAGLNLPVVTPQTASAVIAQQDWGLMLTAGAEVVSWLSELPPWASVIVVQPLGGGAVMILTRKAKGRVTEPVLHWLPEWTPRGDISWAEHMRAHPDLMIDPLKGLLQS